MKERQKDLKFLSEEEYWKLQIFFANGMCMCVLKHKLHFTKIASVNINIQLYLFSPAVIQALGEHLKLRQQVIATATVYFKRFYAR